MSAVKTIPPGTRIGRLTVLGPGVPEMQHGRMQSTSVCKCSCGTIKQICNYRLKAKRPTLSCGCAVHENVHKRVYARNPRMMKGYRYVYCPSAAGANGHGSFAGYVLEHRLVVERAIGRQLAKDEVVHHIDFNKLNNDKRNLILLKNEDHTRLHILLRSGVLNGEDVNTRDKILATLARVEYRVCSLCGCQLSTINLSKSKRILCKRCARTQCAAANKPDKDTLVSLIAGHTYADVGMMFGVSGVTVRRWLRTYGAEQPSRKPHWRPLDGH